MNKKISILIPVYKPNLVYFRHCIESIKMQSYDNYEIIVCDDGSGDLKKREDIMWLANDENKGIAYTRNRLLDAATGNYILWVDSDDSLMSLSALSKLVNHAELTGADIINFQYVFETHEGLYKTSKRDIELKYPQTWLTGATLWNKLYKREIWEGIRFPEGLICHEDAFVVPYLEEKAKKISFIDEAFYFYRYNRESVMRRGLELFALKVALHESKKLYEKDKDINKRRQRDLSMIYYYFYDKIPTLSHAAQVGAYDELCEIFRDYYKNEKHLIESIPSRNRFFLALLEGHWWLWILYEGQKKLVNKVLRRLKDD